MGYEFINVERRERITVITINRPDVMNALHPATSEELDAAFNDFQDDPDQWVAILTGSGEKAFSAGNDLKWQAEHGSAAIGDRVTKLRGGFGGLHKRLDCFKPLIAAVNGFALGGGFELVLACDIVIASERASFGLPEPRVGLMAGAGGVHRLPRQIGYRHAMGMMLTGRRIDAEEALRLGVVNEVVAPGALLDTAHAWAEQILECAPLSVRASKEAALRGLETGLEDALNSVFPLTTAMRKSADFVEGPKAFAEKRKPSWTGE